MEMKRGIALLLSLAMMLNYAPMALAQEGNSQPLSLYDSGEIQGISLSSTNLNLTVGESETLSLLNLPEGEQGQWSSSAPEIATVDEAGLVMAVSEGEANVIATLSETVSVSCKIVVTSQNAWAIAQGRSGYNATISHLSYELVDTIVNGVNTGKKSMLFTLYGTLNTKPTVPSGYQRVCGYMAYGSNDNTNFYDVGNGSSMSSEIGEFNLTGRCGDAIWINGQSSAYMYYKIVFGMVATDDNVYGDEDDIFYPGDEIQFARPDKKTGTIYKNSPPQPSNAIMTKDAAWELIELIGATKEFNKKSSVYAMMTGTFSGTNEEKEFLQKVLLTKFINSVESTDAILEEYKEYFTKKLLDEIYSSTLGQPMNISKSVLEEGVFGLLRETCQIVFDALSNAMEIFGNISKIYKWVNDVSQVASTADLKQTGACVITYFSTRNSGASIESAQDLLFSGPKHMNEWAEYLYQLTVNQDKKIVKSVVAHCPVELIVKNSLGEEVVRLTDAQPGVFMNEIGEFSVVENGSTGEYTKAVSFYSDDYTISFDGVGNGMMDLEIYTFNGDQVQSTIFKELAVKDGSKMIISDSGSKIQVQYDDNSDGVTEDNIEKPLVEIVPQSIHMESSTINAEVGDTKQIDAIVLPARASQRIKWESSDENIADVDYLGNVNAKKVGVTTIRAISDNGIIETCIVTITQGSSGNTETVDITGVSVPNRQYDGKAISHNGTPTAKVNGVTVDIPQNAFTYTWQTAYGIILTDNVAPKDAGNYKLVISANTADYVGTAEISFVISRAPLAITASNMVAHAGMKDLPVPVLSYSGFVNGETEAVLGLNAFAAHHEATVSSPAGEYAIVVSGKTANSNYSVTPHNGILTIRALPTETTDITIDGKSYKLLIDSPTPEQKASLSALIAANNSINAAGSQISFLNISLLDENGDVVTSLPNNERVAIKIPYATMSTVFSAKDEYVILHLKHSNEVDWYLNNEITKNQSGLEILVNSFSPFAVIRTAYSENNSSNGSGGSNSDSSNDAYTFWMQTKERIEEANTGDVVKVNASRYDKMPVSVMTALSKNSSVTLVILWNGGKAITIPAGQAQKPENNRVYYPLSYLAELYENIEFVESPPAKNKVNPETGGTSYIKYANGKQIPITGGILETPITPTVDGAPAATLPDVPMEITPPTAGFEEDAYNETPNSAEARSGDIGLWLAAIAAMFAVLVGGSVWFWKKRQRQN